MTRWSILILFLLVVGVGLAFAGVTVEDISEEIPLGLDLQGGFEVLYEVIPLDESQVVDRELLQSTYSALNRRVDALGVNEPELDIEEPNRIRVRLAGVTDQEEARAILSTQARLSFRDVDDNFKMGGEHLREGSATATFDEYNQPVVSIEFKDTDLATEVTRELYQQPMVIWMDFIEEEDSYQEEREKQMRGEEPKYISAPIIQAVLSRSGQITGMESSDEARELALLLNAGALPVELNEISARSVGASLGEQAMQYTIFAAYIGGTLVLLYMLLYYRLTGFVAALSLVFYVYFILLVFNWMGAVLTLPGIAALVLGVGMAVDANIITNERIKEEIRAGKTIRSAFRAGGARSLRTILDANITTMIAAVVMLIFGDFAIKGFAIMLIITILLSFLTAVLGSRFLLALLINSRAFDRKPRWFGVKESEISEL